MTLGVLQRLGWVPLDSSDSGLRHTSEKAPCSLNQLRNQPTETKQPPDASLTSVDDQPVDLGSVAQAASPQQHGRGGHRHHQLLFSCRRTGHLQVAGEMVEAAVGGLTAHGGLLVRRDLASGGGRVGGAA